MCKLETKVPGVATNEAREGTVVLMSFLEVKRTARTFTKYQELIGRGTLHKMFNSPFKKQIFSK